MELSEITDNVFKNMSEALREMPKDASIPPVALIFKDDHMGLIQTDMLCRTGPAWRHILAQVIKGIHQHQDIEAFCIGMQTWGVLHPGQELIAKFDAGDLRGPGDVPDKDYLLLIIAGNSFQTVLRLWKVSKDAESGQFVDFEEQGDLSPQGAVELIGPFYDILVERPKHMN